jgi:hypothetical protein
VKKGSEKMKKQIDRMIKSETTMLERVLEQDTVLKKMADLEQELFFKKEENKELELEIEKFKFENENLIHFRQKSEDLQQIIRSKGLEITELKLTIKEQKNYEESQNIKILELEANNAEWMKELIQLRSKVIELEHINRINIQNNRLIFNSQRIEFSRFNLGK